MTRPMFLVLGMEDGITPVLGKNEVVADSYTISSHAILVLGQEYVTSKQIANYYGIGEIGLKTGIVVKFGGYYGWAPEELWEKVAEWRHSES